MKSTLSGWKKFLHSLKNRSPLPVVAGWRKPVPVGDHCPRHSHASLEIVYHRSGRGSTRPGHGPEIFFDEGTVVVYAPRESHDQAMDADGEDFCLHLELPAIPLRGAFQVSGLENPLVLAEIESLTTLPLPAEPGLRNILNHRATAVFLTLLETACRQPAHLPPGEARVRRAEEYMKRHFARLDSLAEVARHAGVGHDHLRHLFRARRGRTLVRHLSGLRVAQASLLLTHSDLAVKEIARQCGFRDVYYFTTVFTRLVGLAPARYRNKHRPL